MAYQPPPPPPPQPGGYGFDPQYPQVMYANWGSRVVGYIIDSLIGGIPLGVGYIILLGALAAASASSDSSGPSGFAVFVVFVLALVSLGLNIWNVLIRQGRTGQSLGKQAIGIRLISLQTGQPIGAGMVFVRALCHIVDSLPCYIGWLWPLWDAQRQTFADKIMNTVVVKT